MKKILVLLGLFLLSGATMSYAVMETKDLTNPTYLDNQGYSKETARLVEIQKKEPLTKYEEKQEPNIVIRYIKNFFIAIDPALDRGQFGHSDIPYTNKWNEL